jgi:hypothetical protein
VFQKWYLPNYSTEWFTISTESNYLSVCLRKKFWLYGYFLKIIWETGVQIIWDYV